MNLEIKGFSYSTLMKKFKIDAQMREKRMTLSIPPSIVKSVEVKIAYTVRPTHIAIVKAAAMITVFLSYLMVVPVLEIIEGLFLTQDKTPLL